MKSAGGISFSILVLAGSAAVARAQTLPSGFQEQVVFSGLSEPIAVRFAPDGRVFVAEKPGYIMVYDGLNDPDPELFADLRVDVLSFWDRGLLGIALDPQFPSQPYVYVFYTYDGDIGGSSPKWGDGVGSYDPCPDPPGATSHPGGCVVSGRLARLEAAGNVAVAEEVLLEGWFQQYPSHSAGALAFGPDGYLYAASGDGASFNVVDWGQYESPGEPSSVYPDDPSLEGGALRSQDLYGTGDSVGLSGAVIRIEPETGAPAPGNPRLSDPDPGAARIVAYGLRNPYRMAFRPGTGELWIGDVGWSLFEEIDVLEDPLAGVENFGWPCYEGSSPQPGYAASDLPLCESLYAEQAASAGAVTHPWLAYHHQDQLSPGSGCGIGSSSISGIEFYQYGNYPSEYVGALFFADYSRSCIWAALPGAAGDPDPESVFPFVDGASSPVDLRVGPGGDLFYVDYAGTVRRVRYFAGNQPPTAVIAADPVSGGAPLTVFFDGTGSTDPDPGDTLSYAWDLDGDGQFDDSAAPAPSYTYGAAGNVTVSLLVTDSEQATGAASQLVSVENEPPEAFIDAPDDTQLWRAGDVVTFSGGALDPQQGPLSPGALSWTLQLYHCPSSCHVHQLGSWEGVSSGSFQAPEHEYPSHLVLWLRAVDAAGLEHAISVELYPEVSEVKLVSEPPGLELGFDSEARPAPYSRQVIAGSSHSVAAPSPQQAGGKTLAFASWSDGGEAAHSITASGDLTLTAEFGPAADLEVQVTGGASEAVPGEPMEYRISVFNHGPHAIDALSLSGSSSPPMLEPVYEPGAGSYDVGSATWTGLSLSPGDGAELVMRGMLDPAREEAITFTARAWPIGNGDPRRENNQATVTTELTPVADLGIAKSAGSERAGPGDGIAYALEVSNAGPSDATGVKISDALPQGVELLSAGGAGWTCEVSSGGEVLCQRERLAAGAAAAVSIDARFAEIGGEVANTASVSGDAFDPQPQNDQATAIVRVGRGAGCGCQSGGGAGALFLALPFGLVLASRRLKRRLRLRQAPARAQSGVRRLRQDRHRRLGLRIEPPEE